MNYIELSLEVNSTFAEILVAELAELGFDSFIDTESGFQAYIDQALFNDQSTKLLIENYSAKTPLFYTLKTIEKQNWNQQWESSFSPIIVDDSVYIRASFHEPQDYKYQIVITPKMSFGTGHHETTSQVMSHQLSIDHKNKTILDVGTGTGILAILAEKLGASNIHGFDIDDWSVENTLENINLNQSKKITVSKGTIFDQVKLKYDIVLANINRNILIDEIPEYRKFMKDDAYLIVSGFYTHDASDIENVAKTVNLEKIAEKNKNKWCAIVFKARA